MLSVLHGDCLPILKAMSDNQFDIVITEPPYGRSIATLGHIRTGGSSFAKKSWDDHIPSRAMFDELRRVSRHQVIFGANYSAHLLPPSRCYLIWWKLAGLAVHNYSECELAWTSLDQHPMVFNSRWNGFVRDSKELRYPHPTQKPIAVIQFAIDAFTKVGDTILDPFLGTGTTAVAAHLMGRNCTGIEQDAEYVAMAVERIAKCIAGGE